ncbi:putative protein phosphatase 2C 71 [Raphanus sativus]|nr:putative protein phosphatase 2C 71 [Raphanus sativus]
MLLLIQRFRKIDDSLEFLILASDGLWDVFSNEEAVAVVKEVEEPEESTKKLVGEAIKRGSADNITCVVVRFLESKTANIKDSDISSTHSSSCYEANQEQTAVRDDLDHKMSTKQTRQDRTAVHLDCNAEVEARSDDSGRISSDQKTIQSASESKSSGKQPSQGHIIAHNNLDRTVDNQKPVEAEAIEATHTTSSEQSGSIGEKNQNSTPVHSDSTTSKASSLPSYH